MECIGSVQLNLLSHALYVRLPYTTTTRLTAVCLCYIIMER